MPSFVKSSAALRAVNAPIRCWSSSVRITAGLVAIAVCLSLAVYVVVHGPSVFVMADTNFYLAMATGDYSKVMQPFASRQLGVLIVAALMRLLHWTVERSFLIEGGVSILFTLAAVYALILRTTAPRWILLAVALVPFWGSLLQDLVLPDLWYSALFAAMLLMLDKKKMLGAALMMFPMMLSRESTSLTLLCLLIAAWGWLRWRDRLVAVASTIAGAVVANHLAARAQPNQENLPRSVYMIAKVPWNLMHNILGIIPWSNVNGEFCRVPVWSLQVHFGPVHAIGVCGFSFVGWMEIAQALLTNFGLLPLLFVYLWWRGRKLSLSHNVLLRFTVLYGTASLLLAPALGTWFTHLVGYGWPLFFVALPLMFNDLSEASPERSRAAAAMGFFAVHLILLYVSSLWFWMPQILLDMGLWCVGFLLMRHWFANGYKPIDEAQSIDCKRARPA